MKKSDESKTKSPSYNRIAPTIPSWVDEDHFVDVLEENVDGFKKILDFDARLAGGAGENYASVILRITVKMELKDGSIQKQTFMMKTALQGEQGAVAVKSLCLFPREQEMYGMLLPEFEQMYRNVGKDVRFAPKSYRFKKDPGEEYVLMEDLSPQGFKNVDRLKGLDQEYTESVLRLLAAIHAASAVRYATKGEYDDLFTWGMYTEKNLQIIDNVGKSMQGCLLETLAKYKTTSKYVEKVKRLCDEMTNLFFKFAVPESEEFGVIIHGHLWANNIMFRHNDEGKRQETIFFDFQVSRYTSPAVDLYYFLLSSTEYGIKLVQFDNFVKYYYDHLVENLQLLGYPKKLPTMKALRIDMLTQSFWSVGTIRGVMAAALLDPNETASFENFVEEGTEGRNFKMQLFDNPR